jgi:hypothetical protein
MERLSLTESAESRTTDSMSTNDFGSDAAATPQKSYRPPTGTTSAKSNPPKSRLIQWTGHGQDQYSACEQTWDVLPGGVYNLDVDGEGRLVYCNQPVNIDNLFYFNDSIGDKVIKEIDVFWNSSEKYQMQGYRHRRGYMLYGPQGSGKSSIVQQLIAGITERGGIVFLCTCPPEMLNKALANFRLVEPTRPVLCIFEDIDSIIQAHGDKDILSLLDGESQIDFVLNLATTNYPERLDKRIVSRPRRFDRVIRIDMPDAAVRQAYFRFKMPEAPQEEIDDLTERSDGLSFAAMAEIIISVKCLGNDLTETIEILRDMSERIPSSRDYADDRKVGFGERRR